MKTLKEFNFVEKKDSQKKIDACLTNLTMSELKGGVEVNPCIPMRCDVYYCSTFTIAEC